MHHEQRDVQALGIDLGVRQQSMLGELLAMVGSDDEGGLVGEAQPLDLAPVALQLVIDVGDRRVVERSQVGELFGRGDQLLAIEVGECRPVGGEHAVRRRSLPESLDVLLRRSIGIVHAVGVQEEEEALFGRDAAQEGQAQAEGPLDVGVRDVGVIGPVGEAAAEAEPAGHPSPLAVPRGPEPSAGEELGEGRNGGGEDVSRWHDVVLAGVEPGENRHVRLQRAGVLRVSALEQHPARRQAIEEGAGGLGVAVGAEVIGAQGVDRNQDDAPGRRRREAGDGWRCRRRDPRAARDAEQQSGQAAHTTGNPTRNG